MNRTVLIGLDGATFSILDPLMREGLMPFLAELTTKGVRATLLSTPNPLTPPAWTSLMTGRTPGNHGIFDFLIPQETEHGVFLKLLSGRDIQCETVWALVSRHGGKIAALNFPMTYPLRSVTGYVVPGFMPPRQLKRSIQPAGWYEQLAQFPWFQARELAMDLEREKAGIQGLPPEDYADWVRLHIRRERQWRELLRWVMCNDPCDLTAVLFDGVDRIQHLTWRFLDPECFPPVPTPWEREIRTLCRDYFRELDEHLRAAVELAGPDARVFLASDHGFGPSVEVFYLNVWLQQHGYLQWGSEAALDTEEGILARRMKTQYGLLDWAKTVAYALTPSCNGIYIRVARRPGRPGVPPDAYESFRAELINKLLSFPDPESGEPVVRRVMTREEAFPGDYMHLAPDLTLVLRDYGFISVLNADAPLKRRSEPKGMHRPEGIFLAAGPGIKRGVVVPPLSIVDVTPALLYSLGLPIPADFEGRLPREIFADAVLQGRPPVYGEATGVRRASLTPDPAKASVLESDQEEAVLSRLRALGYVE
ncbi:MAG: alkaline phosphatase family protein [Thermodesulfobacteriota bacterium]